MNRLIGTVAAAVLFASPLRVDAMDTTQDSACAPLLATGQQKGIKFGKDAKKTGLFGAILGGVAGAVIAATTSNDRNKAGDMAQGAAIGAALGGAVGVGIGQIAENRRAAFESESAYLACEISYAEEELARRELQAVAAEQDLAAAISEAAALRADIAANQAKAKELKALSSKWKKKIEQYDADLDAWKQQIEYFDTLASRTNDKPGDNSKALAKRHQELARRKGDLQTRYNRVAFVRDELIVQRNKIGKG
jgi:uncharacterized protein (DUF3084 family)